MNPHAWTANDAAVTTWRAIMCRGTDCTRLLTFAVHAIHDAEAVLKRAAATLAWYPMTAHDWLCPDCGWARELRNDSRATNARSLRTTLQGIWVAR